MTKCTLSVKETAELLGVSTATIYKMAREGQIPVKRVRKLLLFNRDTIESWLKGETGENGRAS